MTETEKVLLAIIAILAAGFVAVLSMLILALALWNLGLTQMEIATEAASDELKKVVARAEAAESLNEAWGDLFDTIIEKAIKPEGKQ